MTTETLETTETIVRMDGPRPVSIAAHPAGNPAVLWGTNLGDALIFRADEPLEGHATWSDGAHQWAAIWPAEVQFTKARARDRDMIERNRAHGALCVLWADD